MAADERKAHTKPPAKLRLKIQKAKPNVLFSTFYGVAEGRMAVFCDERATLPRRNLRFQGAVCRLVLSFVNR